MKQYKCDYCSKTILKPNIKATLLDTVETYGDTLTQGKLYEVHFCNSGCFWNWARSNSPYTRCQGCTCTNISECEHYVPLMAASNKEPTP